MSKYSEVASRRHVGFAVMAGLLLVLSACSASALDEKQGPAPKFEGPWAAEFDRSYSTAESDFERGALRDGKISEEEYAEMTTRMTKCLKDEGITFSGFDESGAYDTDFSASMGPDRANELTKACSRSSGESSIGALYNLIQSNPNNLDVTSAMAACLVARGVVSADYTGKDWARESAADKYSFIVDETSGRAAIVDCNRDPLSQLPD